MPGPCEALFERSTFYDADSSPEGGGHSPGKIGRAEVKKTSVREWNDV